MRSIDEEGKTAGASGTFHRLFHDRLRRGTVNAQIGFGISRGFKHHGAFSLRAYFPSQESYSADALAVAVDYKHQN